MSKLDIGFTAFMVILLSTVLVTGTAYIKDKQYCESRNGVYVHEHCFKKELFNE